MDFLKKVTSEVTTGTNTTTTPAENKGTSEHSKPSQAELFSSAQVVAGAARATIQKEPNKVDNAKVAGAAADLLDAAQQYGKLDSKTGIGGYVEKAETYLHQYESSHSTTTTPAKTTPPAAGQPATTTPARAEDRPKTEEAKTGGGIGDYMKMAEGFMNKGSEGKNSESGDSGSGYGDMMKMAGDFMKKN